jgi:hypothetical protein
MSTIQELGAFLAREQAAGTTPQSSASTPPTVPAPAAVGQGGNGAPTTGDD